MKRILAFLVLCATPVLHAQVADTAPPPIRDNSFLVEEAYNQESRVVQHISTFSRRPGNAEWSYLFTQEWPVRSERHQLSLSVPIHRHAPGAGLAMATGVGDVAVNYRLQLPVSSRRLAVAPRLSLVLPTGDSRAGHGTGSTGVQGNLPVSVELTSRVVSHTNAGLALAPRARIGGSGAAAHARIVTVSASQSLVLLATNRMNLLLETSWARTGITAAGSTVRESELLLAPGIRWAHDIGGLQVVPGAAWVSGIGPSRGDRAILLYLSIEHPF